MLRAPRWLVPFTAALLLFHQSFAFLPFTDPRWQNAFTRRQMFTGIVDEIGTVKAFEVRDDIVMSDGSTGQATLLTVEGNVVMEGAYPG